MGALAGLGGIVQIDPRGMIIGFVPIPNGDTATTNFAFGGPDNQYIYFEGATSGTFWRFKAPYPGLIGPGGVRLPPQLIRSTGRAVSPGRLPRMGREAAVDEDATLRRLLARPQPIYSSSWITQPPV